jgi:hypothetical protein
LSIAAAASQLHVGRGTVVRAKAVEEHGSAALKKAVASGDVGLKPAAQIAKLPKGEQRKALSDQQAGEATPPSFDALFNKAAALLKLIPPNAAKAIAPTLEAATLRRIARLTADVARHNDSRGLSLLAAVYEEATPKEAAAFLERFATADAIKHEL